LREQKREALGRQKHELNLNQQWLRANLLADAEGIPKNKWFDNKIKSLQANLTSIERRVEMARKEKIETLASIFRLRNGEKHCMIVNVGLPILGLYKGTTDRIVRAGLKYILQVLTTIAAWLDVNLPLKISMGDIDGWPERVDGTPLSRAHVKGLSYINYNIAYLCASQGVLIDQIWAARTLQNLLRAIASPRLGSMPRPVGAVFTAIPGRLLSKDAPKELRFTVELDSIGGNDNDENELSKSWEEVDPQYQMD